MKIRIRTGLKIKGADLKALQSSIAALADRRVLVGIPRETTDRGDGEAINNAELGYIHNFGAPEANIPQREFMAPGVRPVLDQIIDEYKGGAIAALSNKVALSPTSSFPALDRYLHRIGLIAQQSIKATIRAGLSPELAPMTVQARIARRQSKSWRRKRQAMVDANVAAGKAPGAGIFTPLIDTAGMINAITYVIRRQSRDQDIAVGPTPGRTTS